jgi:hypothetical protein
LTEELIRWYKARNPGDLPLMHTARSHKIRKLFLDVIEKGYSESKAAKAAGESVRFFRTWRDEDANFRQDWEDAESAGTDRLEDVATKRGIKQSYQLLTHMMRARRPAKHREKPPEVNVSVQNDITAVDAELERKIAKAIGSDKGGAEAGIEQRAEPKAKA